MPILPTPILDSDVWIDPGPPAIRAGGTAALNHDWHEYRRVLTKASHYNGAVAKDLVIGAFVGERSGRMAEKFTNKLTGGGVHIGAGDDVSGDDKTTFLDVQWGIYDGTDMSSITWEFKEPGGGMDNCALVITVQNPDPNRIWRSLNTFSTQAATPVAPAVTVKAGDILVVLLGHYANSDPGNVTASGITLTALTSAAIQWEANLKGWYGVCPSDATVTPVFSTNITDGKRVFIGVVKRASNPNL